MDGESETNNEKHKHDQENVENGENKADEKARLCATCCPSPLDIESSMLKNLPIGNKKELK